LPEVNRRAAPSDAQEKVSDPLAGKLTFDGKGEKPEKSPRVILALIRVKRTVPYDDGAYTSSGKSPPENRWFLRPALASLVGLVAGVGAEAGDGDE
jgi:hypothetical protein